MIANITTGKDVYGALAYNQQKVDKEKGCVLATNNICEPLEGPADIAGQILGWMPPHIRTEKPVVHVSLNPDSQDTLSDDELADIAGKYMDGMGWASNPISFTNIPTSTARTSTS